MKANILTLAITLTVGLILAGSVLAPVIADSQDALLEKKTNTGTVLLSLAEGAHDGTVTIESDTIVFTVDDKVLTQTLDAAHRRAVAIGNNFMIGASSSNIVLDYWNGTNAGHVTSNVTSASFEIAADKTVTLKYTVSGTETTINVPENDWIFIADDAGTYVESDAYYGGSSYLTSLDQFYAGSWTFVNNYQFGMHNTDVTVNGTAVDPEDVIIDTEADGGFIKVNYAYTESKTYFTFDDAGTDKTVNVFNVIVPKSVQYLPDGNKSIDSLYGAILPMMIISLVLMAAGAIFIRSRE